MTERCRRLRECANRRRLSNRLGYCRPVRLPDRLALAFRGGWPRSVSQSGRSAVPPEPTNRERPMSLHQWMTLMALTALASACGDSSGSTDPGTYDPDIPTAWAAAVTNPLFPLAPGSVWHYRAVTGNGVETTRTEVLPDTKVISGVTATIVHDQVFLDGELAEDTFDWYTQDVDGNVWYVGEDSKEIENGQVVSTEGSWEWGVDSALPGVIMWADPSAHMEEYRQEYLKGVAEDLAKVVALDESVEVPSGSYTGCLKTQERSALESNSTEFKYYCDGVGTVLETNGSGGQRDELQEVTAP